MICPSLRGIFCGKIRRQPAALGAAARPLFAPGCRRQLVALGYSLRVDRARSPSSAASGAPIATPSAPSVGAAPRAAVKRGSLRCRAPGAGDGGALMPRVPRKRSERGTPGAERRPDQISRGLTPSGQGAIVAPVVRFAGVFALSGSHYPANHKTPHKASQGLNTQSKQLNYRRA
jgi:hypothetical protein